MPKTLSVLALIAVLALSHLGAETKKDADGKSKKSEAKAQLLKKLQGVWKVVKMEIDGQAKGQADRYSILFDGDTYYFLVDGQRDPNSAKVFLDPTKEPIAIDLVLKGVGVAGTHLGILRFTDGGLEICMNQPRGAGSDKRPKEFTTRAKVGAGAILFVLERPADFQALDDKDKGKQPTGDAKTKKQAIVAELKKLSGNWTMAKLEVEGELKGNIEGLGVLFDEDIFHAVVDSRKSDVSAKIFLDPTKEPKTIDLVMKGGGVDGTKLGIYRFTEDGLEICMNPPRGAGSDKRPTAFTTKAQVGAGRILFILERSEK